jgi:hypothetical protein
MNAQEFCYWLQGSSELNPEWVPSPEQWQSIKEHLQTVFVKVTPQISVTPMAPMHPGQSGIRTLELRPADRLAELMRGSTIAWPGGVAPTITC